MHTTRKRILLYLVSLGNLICMFQIYSCTMGHTDENSADKHGVPLPGDEQHEYVYLHGFASSPESYKGVKFRQHFAQLKTGPIILHTPDLNVPSLAQLTYTGALAAIDKLYDSFLREADNKAVKIHLIGSSLGGYLAARYAELYPDRVGSLVLLCPAFDLLDRWPRVLGKQKMDNWEKTGKLAYPDGKGEIVEISFNLVTDARSHPSTPIVPAFIKTLIIHGKHDEVVPIELSRAYIKDREDYIRLVEVDDDHGLAADVPDLTDMIVDFFRLDK